MTLALLSVNCGTPRIIGARNGQPLFSAIGKKPVDSAAALFGELGIEGDMQANLAVHGGADQAVCVYSADHWTWWREQMNLDCAAGTFGENLTVRGADESSVGIGDRFAWGAVVLEVTQPRGPCANVDLYHGRSGLAQTMTLTIRCGWYMRVIRGGVAPARAAGLRHTRVSGPSIRDTFAARYDANTPLARRRDVHDCPALSARWRRAIACTFA
jgi:MOSC domain-containing protein YiiM